MAAVTAITAVNYQGVRKTAWLSRAVVVVALGSLGAVVVAALSGGTASVERLGPVGVGGVGGILEAAGLLFFAFAGYARIATLGEEVIDPGRTIPRAIPLALAITLAVYVAVAVSVLLAVGPGPLADSRAPLATAVQAGSLHWLAPAVRVGGTVAALGALLSLMAGVSRTAFAMSANRDLLGVLDAVHPTHRVPHRAELAVGVVVAGLVLVADLREAIGFSSFAVLSYYAIANAAAWTLPADQRRWPRWLTAAGVVGCAVLAVALPPASVVTGLAVLGLGAGIWAIREGLARGGQSPTR